MPTAALSPATEGIASNAAVKLPLCEGKAKLFQVAFAVVVEHTTAGFTVRLTVALWLRPPLVPVIVSVAMPCAAELLAVMVSVHDIVAAHVVAVTPEGRPEVTLTLTLPLNPFAGVTVAV